MGDVRRKREREVINLKKKILWKKNKMKTYFFASDETSESGRYILPLITGRILLLSKNNKDTLTRLIR